MTRAHAARQLLRHGPLTLSEFIDITGWQYVQARKTLNWLACERDVIFDGTPRHNGVWRLSKRALFQMTGVVK